MTAVEAAASLFGSEEPASDPFAALGNETNFTAGQQANERPPSNIGGSAASGLFDSGADDVSFLGAEQHSTTQHDSWSEPVGQAQYDQNSNSYPSDLSSGGFTYDNTQGWYDEAGNWHYNEVPQDTAPAAQVRPANVAHPPSGTAHDPYGPTSNHGTTSSYAHQDHSYDSYTPAAHNTPYYTPSSAPNPYLPSASSSYANQDPQSALQPMYSAYTPPVQNPSSYIPASSVTPASRAVYNQNNPSGATTQSSVSHAASQTHHGPPSTTTLAVPVASVNRPKKANAYDPPLPSTTSRRASRMGRSASPAVGQQIYTAHSSYAPAVPPLPQSRPYSTHSNGHEPPASQPGHFSNTHAPVAAGSYGHTSHELRVSDGYGNSSSDSNHHNDFYVSAGLGRQNDMLTRSQDFGYGGNAVQSTNQSAGYTPLAWSPPQSSNSADAPEGSLTSRQVPSPSKTKTKSQSQSIHEPHPAINLHNNEQDTPSGYRPPDDGYRGFEASRYHPPPTHHANSYYQSAGNAAPPDAAPDILGESPNFREPNDSLVTHPSTSGYPGCTTNSPQPKSVVQRSIPPEQGPMRPAISPNPNAPPHATRPDSPKEARYSLGIERSISPRSEVRSSTRQVPYEPSQNVGRIASSYDPKAPCDWVSGSGSLDGSSDASQNVSGLPYPAEVAIGAQRSLSPISDRSLICGPQSPPRPYSHSQNDMQSPGLHDTGSHLDIGRATLPGSVDGRSLNEAPNSIDPYAPHGNVSYRDSYDAMSSDRAAIPATISTGQYTAHMSNNTVSQPYESGSRGSDRTPSPEASSSHPWNDTHLSPDHYAPPKSNAPVKHARPTRSTSNGPILSLGPNNSRDPYNASRYGRQQISETDYGDYSSRYDYPDVHEVDMHGQSAPRAYSEATVQEISLSAPTFRPYAPSPSLLGSNDPLGRTAARVPVFSFGFAGQVVTCFHGSSTLHSGFDVALSSRNSTDITVRVLHKIIPESALDDYVASYPGPLFSDPTTSIVRTGAAAHVKSKKLSIAKYLGERIDELARGIGYLNKGSHERRRAEGKLVIVKLLDIMVQNDGLLTGSPQTDNAVRDALIPRLGISGSTAPQDTSLVTPAIGFTSASELNLPGPSVSSINYTNLGVSISESNETPIAISTLRPSTLDRIKEFLLRGDRRKAYHYALDQKLWAHAMVIASSIDKEAWQEVVNEFIRTELGTMSDLSRTSSFGQGPTSNSSTTNGRESLRVAYSMFSGQGAASVQQLLSYNISSRASLHVPGMQSHTTPLSPNFPLPSVNVPIESLSLWFETAAMLLSSPMSPECSAALTALGDCLMSNQWTEAAHACYLLAPQTSPMGGIGGPSTRIVLLGSQSPQLWPIFHKDPDPIIFSEIAEFAMSLATTPKGQDTFNGLPHLQVYRFIRATSLAEMGHLHLASRYCEAIAASLSRSSPYFTQSFLEQLEGLTDRIVGSPNLDKSGSWIGGRMSKPSLDSTLTWLEGRFTKLITGDGDSTPPPTEQISGPEQQPFGPFSHYSTISSATTSARSSPQPSTTHPNVLPPPRRSGSAMGVPLAQNSRIQIDRASSAMDYIRHRPLSGELAVPPVPRVASASAATTTFAQSQSFGQAINGYVPSDSLHSNQDSNELMTPTPNSVNGEGSNQEVSWWGSSYTAESSAATPTATTFLRVDGTTLTSSSDGFISLMDDSALSVVSSPPVKNEHPTDNEEDEEDLGFGNSSSKCNATASIDQDSTNESSPATVGAETKADPEKVVRPELKEGASSSWLSRWWKRSDTPGPIKASLGEEKTFYYDKELKRWVNKNAASEPEKPVTPPPPPSRAQTASPGRSKATLSPGTNQGLAPPARSASAIDLSTSPPSKTVVRVRSNLVPPSEADSTPSAQSASSSFDPPTPPPGRPKSQASKRNIRSRYVPIS